MGVEFDLYATVIEEISGKELRTDTPKSTRFQLNFCITLASES